MKKHLFALGVCLLSLFIISCKRQNAPNTYSVIPYPNSLVQEDGTFVFNKKTKMICTSSLDSASQEVVRNFSALLNNVAGLKTECIVEEEKREKNIVFFDLDKSRSNGVDTQSRSEFQSKFAGHIFCKVRYCGFCCTIAYDTG